MNAKQWAMVLHLSLLAGFVIPFAGLAAPIIIWQLKKSEFPELETHGRIVANWLISALIYGVVSAILIFVFVGFLLLGVLSLLCVVFPIIGGIKASNGETWKYPMSISFLK